MTRLLCNILALFAMGTTVAETGQWSRSAVAVHLAPSHTQRIVAPDGKTSVIVKDGEVYLSAQGRLSKPATEGIPISYLTEVGWAPDSKALFVTESDGGWVGNWDAYVLEVRQGGLREVHLTASVKKDFVKKYKCQDFKGMGQQPPNLGAIQWLKESQELLVLAEVPPVSTCPVWLVMGYAVAVPSGKILATYTENQLRSRWGALLGPRHKDRWK